jgi:hypothetical protein
VINAVDLF